MTDDRDAQDHAESFDEDLLGTGGLVLADEACDDLAPDRPRAVRFADADVTDESVADRLAQEEPDEPPAEWDDLPVDPDDLPVDPDDYPDEEETGIDIDDASGR